VSEPESEAGLQRLQKIIAAAGVASRRKAEELIASGRVQINGQIVTELGTKADPARDHIRVDGKLLHGPEHHRYFVLNKPRGYITTASDPEGRPTVMDFFKGGERLFPVGRLDYASEGLLLMTNDGALANSLTRAAARVEKTYLVKVSGHPSESALNQLREGVMIDRASPIRKPAAGPSGAPRRSEASQHAGGEDRPLPRTQFVGPRGRVMTAPARIRLFREGENPWYEMILIEGRNREIRKMFEEVGHHVEKIRRVGYGPLVLDLEPGRFRELTPDEVDRLRRAASGRLRPYRGPEVDSAERPARRGRPAPARKRTSPTTRTDSAARATPGRRRRPAKPRHRG
jgi:23S rRNA pseudouridine2605 synthase